MPDIVKYSHLQTCNLSLLFKLDVDQSQICDCLFGQMWFLLVLIMHM